MEVCAVVALSPGTFCLPMLGPAQGLQSLLFSSVFLSYQAPRDLAGTPSWGCRISLQVQPALHSSILKGTPHSLFPSLIIELDVS